MKIAIVSDTHDHIEPLDQVLEYAKRDKIQILIHCGDVSSRETLDYIRKNFTGEIYLCLGNADNFSIEKKQARLHWFKQLGQLDIDNKRIYFIHKIAEIKKEIIDNSDVVFYGHDHKPWMKLANNTIIANPGNCAGIGYMGTFAVYDTTNNKIKLEIIDKLVK